jgi:hypothetical protein
VSQTGRFFFGKKKSKNLLTCCSVRLISTLIKNRLPRMNYMKPTIPKRASVLLLISALLTGDQCVRRDHLR